MRMASVKTWKMVEATARADGEQVAGHLLDQRGVLQVGLHRVQHPEPAVQLGDPAVVLQLGDVAGQVVHEGGGLVDQRRDDGQARAAVSSTSAPTNTIATAGPRA